MDATSFCNLVLREGKKHYRDMPWRKTKDPYRVLLSEVMLQQTQVDRVIPYYEKFIAHFLTVETLAAAPLSDILALWSGLGYNRRAKWLQESAQRIVLDFNGQVPSEMGDLMQLPGIGHNTAAAVCVYAFGKNEVFVETNIRTVYIHHLFNNSQDTVHDTQILNKQKDILDSGVDSREWYLALMDYGTFLKKTVGNVAQRSRHYRKQSAFVGSLRQVRGAIVKLLVKKSTVSSLDITNDLADYEESLRNKAMSQLIREQFVIKDTNGYYSIKK